MARLPWFCTLAYQLWRDAPRIAGVLRGADIPSFIDQEFLVRSVEHLRRQQESLSTSGTASILSFRRALVRGDKSTRGTIGAGPDEKSKRLVGCLDLARDSVG